MAAAPPRRLLLTRSECHNLHWLHSYALVASLKRTFSSYLQRHNIRLGRRYETKTALPIPTQPLPSCSQCSTPTPTPPLLKKKNCFSQKPSWLLSSERLFNLFVSSTWPRCHVRLSWNRHRWRGSGCLGKNLWVGNGEAVQEHNKRREKKTTTNVSSIFNERIMRRTCRRGAAGRRVKRGG